VSLPPEVEQAIDKRSSMAAVGNLNDFVKFQMAQGMAQPGGSSAGGFATEMAVGMAMAQQMMQQQGGVLGPQATPGVPPPLPGQAPSPPPPARAPAAAGPVEWLSPGDVANTLGVSEGDVLATIEAGDLKAKKIGSTWRISRAAMDEFMKS
jgi:excisionase family DNA binding protein